MVRTVITNVHRLFQKLPDTHFAGKGWVVGIWLVEKLSSEQVPAMKIMLPRFHTFYTPNHYPLFSATGQADEQGQEAAGVHEGADQEQTD